MQFNFLKRLFGLRPTPPPPFVPPKKGAKPPAKSAKPAKNTAPAAPPVALPDIAQLLQESRTLLATAGAVALAARVQVRWNPRMRSTAGMAYPTKALVTLNPRLAEFGEGEISRTLRHELAHLLAHERAGRRGIAAHGAEWRKACCDLGLPNERRTHDLPLPRRELKRRYHYCCPACGTEVGRVRPLRRDSACVQCCRTHSRGRYDARFRFVRVKTKDE